MNIFVVPVNIFVVPVNIFVVPVNIFVVPAKAGTPFAFEFLNGAPAFTGATDYVSTRGRRIDMSQRSPEKSLSSFRCPENPRTCSTIARDGLAYI